MRKKFAGAATAIILASSFTGVASASSYEVKSGDTLWKIAGQYNLTIPQLKELNSLSTDVIFPKQVLQVDNVQLPVSTNQTNTPAAPKATQEKKTASDTYTVISGDNLSKIAARHSIALTDLFKWNGLKSDLIRPGQKLIVSEKPSNSTTATVESEPASPTVKPVENSSEQTYKVVSGDSLSRIGARVGATVNDLKKWNSLTSDLILVGQVLNINAKAGAATVAKAEEKAVAKAEVKPNTTASVKEDPVIEIAKSMLGIKYVWGGSTRSGFDCSGFIYYAFNQSGEKISRLSTDGYFNRSYYVNKPEPGDLIFFENTYKKGISHMGIYLGNGQFIHASSTGVEISNVSNSYWKSKFNGYKKFY